jgi:hypothetical protein
MVWQCALSERSCKVFSRETPFKFPWRNGGQWPFLYAMSFAFLVRVVFQSFQSAFFSLLAGGLKKTQGTPARKKSAGVFLQPPGEIALRASDDVGPCGSATAMHRQ